MWAWTGAGSSETAGYADPVIASKLLTITGDSTTDGVGMWAWTGAGESLTDGQAEPTLPVWLLDLIGASDTAGSAMWAWTGIGDSMTAGYAEPTIASQYVQLIGDSTTDGQAMWAWTGAGASSTGGAALPSSLGPWMPAADMADVLYGLDGTIPGNFTIESGAVAAVANVGPAPWVAAQATPAQRPTLVGNAVRFTAASLTSLDLSNAAISGPITVMVLGTVRATGASWQRLWSLAAAGAGDDLATADGVALYHQTSGGGGPGWRFGMANVGVAYPGIVNGVPFAYVAKIDGATLATHFNGTDLAAAAKLGTGTIARMSFGRSVASYGHADVDIVWAYVVQGIASEETIDRFVGAGLWLLNRVDLLPADHPYKAARPLSGAVLPPSPPPTTNVVVRARQDAVAGANAQFKLAVADVLLPEVHDVTSTTFADVAFTIDGTPLPTAKIGIRFLNDFYSAGPPVLDRNLYIESVTIGDRVLLGTAGTYYDETTGQTITGAAAGNMYNVGVLEWTAASPPPTPTPGAVLARSGAGLTYGGAPTKLWGVNFRPWQAFDIAGPPTWSDQVRDRVYSEIANIKNSWGGNYIRTNIAPGEYRYWKNPARNRFWTFLDGLLDRALAEGMFIELNWWTVGCPDGERADDSFFRVEYNPGYDTSFALCKEFWLAAATRYKTYGHVIFSLWDEPLKRVASDTWVQLHPYMQELATIIRGAGAPNLLSIPGNHYSRDVREILTTHPIVDATENWAVRYHEFASGEPQNYLMFMTSGGTRLDSVRPLIIGGTGYEPVTLTEPPALLKSWLDTYVYPLADVLAWWDGSAYNTPNLYQTGYPTDAPTTYTAYGNYARARPLSPLLRPGGSTSPPSPPPPGPVQGQPVKIAAIPPPVDLTGSANWYLDSNAGSNGNGSLGSPFNNWPSFIAALQPGQIGAIKAGTTINRQGNQFGFSISGKGGCTIGYYGTGARPILKNSVVLTGGFVNVGGNVWRRSVGAMPSTTAYAAASVTHATNCIVNGSHWCSWYARNGAGEVGARNDMFYHTNGDLTFNSNGLTPTSLEVPWQTTMIISGSDGFRLQDLDIGHSRDHGIIVSQMDNVIVRRCIVRRCGLTGIYWQSKSNQVTFDCIVEDNQLTEIHAEGLSMAWPGNVRNAFRRAKVRRNKVHKTCMGPPFIFSGSTSQDFYSAAIKFFTQNWESATWWNDMEVYDNHIHDIGNVGVAYVYSGNYRYDGASGYESNQAMGVWPDTVTGHPTLGGVKMYNNWIENTWGAGVFIENCPDGGHHVYENLFINAGTNLTGYSGAVCVGRGSRQMQVYKNTIRSCPNGGLVLQANSGTTVTGDGRSFSEGVQNNVLRDNIVSQTNNYPAIYDRSRDGGSSNVFTKNLVHGGPYLYHPNQPWNNPSTYANAAAYSTARGGGISGTVEADPLFVNAGAGDFSLQTNSPARNVATDGGNIGAV